MRHLPALNSRAGKALVAIALTLVLVAVVFGLASEDALARVGGGQTSRSSSSSSSGGSSSGGSEGDILFFLIYLAIEVPVIGVPLLLLFVGFIIFRAIRAKGSGGGVHVQTHGPTVRSPKRRTTQRQVGGLPALRQLDSGLSLPVLYDFVQLVHRRATEAAVTGTWAPLAPFVDGTSQQALTAFHQGVTEVSDVVVGGLTLAAVEVSAKRVTLRVQIKGTRLERRGRNSQRVYVEERWTFARDRSAVSLPPEDMLRMGCPSCASAVDTDAMGACKSCGTPINKGQLQWQVTGVQVGARQPYAPPEVGLVRGGDEPSVNDPTRFDPRLGPEMRGFMARHPDMDWRAFEDHVREVYMALQSAWSAGTWSDARPHVTDPMYQTLRFWIEKYAANGLRNSLSDVQLLKQQVVKIEVDAWYESITVRIWGSMIDATVEVGSGKLVGGNDKKARRFSEYWTFLRASGTGAASKDAHSCPSCGAALDRISQAGVCGYCDTVITTGRFDWVLSRIHQTAEYEG